MNTKNKGGRPPIPYNPELAEALCSRLATGEPLVKVVKDSAFPSIETIYKWLRENEEFAELYARAKDDSADTLASDIHNIAEGTLSGKYDSNAARVAIDALKWTASKLKPKRYGDKISSEVKLDVADPVVELLKQLRSSEGNTGTGA
jgi:hypothetical protein